MSKELFLVQIRIFRNNSTGNIVTKSFTNEQNGEWDLMSRDEQTAFFANHTEIGGTGWFRK